MSPRVARPLHWHQGLWPRLAVAVALAQGLAGCQWPANRTDGTLSPEQDRLACEGDLGPARNTQLATIEQQIADGRTYAALAQLDALQVTSRKAVWLRAEALRRIDRPGEAAALYHQLESTCMAGRARHGLGLIAAQVGNWADALNDLQMARTLLPLDVRVRNDLGYALLLNRHWEDARFEFLTVLDLAPADGLASRNLVLMAYMQGKPELAQVLMTRFKLDAEAGDRLSRQAADLMKQGATGWLSPPAQQPADARPTSVHEAASSPDTPPPAASEPTVTPLTSPASGAS